MAKRSFRLTGRQQELLRQKLRERGGQSTLETLPRRADPAERPLSFGQRRLWFLEQLEPGRAAFSLPALVRLAGPLRLPERPALGRYPPESGYSA